MYISSMQSIEVLSFFVGRHSMTKYFRGVLGREDAASKELQLRKIALANKVDEPQDLVLIDDRRRVVDRCSKLGFRCIPLKRDRLHDLVQVVSRLYQQQSRGRA